MENNKDFFKDKIFYFKDNGILNENEVKINNYIKAYNNNVFVTLYKTFRKLNIKYCDNDLMKYNKIIKLSCILYNFKLCEKRIKISGLLEDKDFEWIKKHKNFKYDQQLFYDLSSDEEEEIIDNKDYNPFETYINPDEFKSMLNNLVINDDLLDKFDDMDIV